MDRKYAATSCDGLLYKTAAVRKLKDYLAAGPQPHMIVMNGDSSLSAALEQCLTASHTIPSDTASKSAGS
eukprot:701832-Amphidinium_carterae.1